MAPAEMVIVTPQSAVPRCDAIVDLISRVRRPYLFRVTVTGLPPHVCQRVYVVQAPKGAGIEAAANSCAMKGLELFIKEFMPPVVRDQMAPLAKATLQ